MTMDCPTERPGLLIARLCHLHHQRAHELFGRVGLHRGQNRLLRALWDREGLTHGDLAEALGVAPATVTRMVQRMERGGFVRREADAEDQRISRVYLTERGRAVREEVERIATEFDGEILAGLSCTERRELIRILKLVLTNLATTDENGEADASLPHRHRGTGRR